MKIALPFLLSLFTLLAADPPKPPATPQPAKTAPTLTAADREAAHVALEALDKEKQTASDLQVNWLQSQFRITQLKATYDVEFAKLKAKCGGADPTYDAQQLAQCPPPAPAKADPPKK